MAAKKVPFLHETGLHMRPAGRIMETARKFQSDVRLVWAGRRADAKSILELLSLGIPAGSELLFEAQGPDANEALTALESLITTQINRFEDE